VSTVLIVGSGPSGVHLAQTLLERGHHVTMLDVGHEKPEPVKPDADFESLKAMLDDPAEYFLGTRGQGIVFPSPRPRYYALPPSKDYVFATPKPFAAAPTNFEPVFSFAAGGLAEAWTGGSYPLNDDELKDFPFGFADIEPHYATVLRRIGVSAQRDDLERFSAWFDDYLPCVKPDPHTAHLLLRYAQVRTRLNESLGFYLGRSRLALLTRDHGDRKGCEKLGRCLWGCPRQSIYAPSSTLRQLRKHPQFRYLPGRYVTHFEYDGERVSAVCALLADGTRETHSAEAYALAAGTLCSSKIVLDSIWQRTGQVHQLTGLMDNRQILMPFLSPSRLGLPVSTREYQLQQIAFGIARPQPEEYVHGQITTLKAASVHPVVQNLPFDLRSALGVFRIAHAALGAANIWLHDRRDASNVLTIRPRPDQPATELVVRCTDDEDPRAAEIIPIVKQALRRLGCFVPPGMTRLLPRGASIHYAGTLPMQNAPRPFSCAPNCRSHDFRNLFFADGATFPFLPSKNLTFTLMANAVRVGEAMDRDLRAASVVAQAT
jgi:choline dehydrogenase-like flavoprotein